MYSINRFNSPMALCLEDLTEPPLEQERRKETTQKAVRESPSSFLIGSLERISQKVAHLEQELRTFGADDLVIESTEFCRTLSPAAHLTPGYELKTARTQLDQSTKIKERDKKDLQRFTQRYQLSMRNTTNTDFAICPQIQGSAKHKKIMKPKLVELCQFPGFSDHGPMPLPHQTALTTIIDKVVSAHKNTGGKVFPSALSQAMYSSFCFSFSQSLHQFQAEDFKTQLCNLLWQWIGGISPTPGSYNTWDYLALEPNNYMIHGKEMQNKASATKEGKKLKGEVLKELQSCDISPAKESYRACCGPDFTHMLFNLKAQYSDSVLLAEAKS